MLYRKSVWDQMETAYKRKYKEYVERTEEIYPKENK